MFSRRKSRPLSSMPPHDPSNASSNALAAATAIGQALKTGSPIPRSNSLQRSSSLMRRSASFQTRSGSLTGLSNSGFQRPPQQQQQQQQQQPTRSQSLATESSSASLPNLKPATKPKTIKKHIPGPYGLITIEVPVQEEMTQQAKRTSVKNPTIKRSQNSTKPKPRFNSFDQGSIGRRPTFVDALKEVDELKETDFTPNTTVDVVDHVQNNKITETVVPQTSADSIQIPEVKIELSEEAFGADQADDHREQERELQDLKAVKDADEIKLVEKLEQVLDVEQLGLNKATENSGGSTSDFEGDFVDHYADVDIPSTAKSSDTFNFTQSSMTTEDTALEEKQHSSMAQTLRPKIPSQYTNSHDDDDVVDDRRSSVYSSDSGEPPLRSSMRQSAPSPMKSALKYKASSSSINLPDDRNPANAAYLSLTTAENTRLNASQSTSTLSRSVSNRALKSDKPQAVQTQNGVRPPQPQFSQQQPQQRSSPQSARPRPVSTMDSPSRKPPQQSRRPMSAVPSTQQQQQYQQSQKNRMPQKPLSSAGAAALNAVRKPDPLPPKLERKSSFEKERPHDSHAAFKRMSLRDPSIGTTQPREVESQMGYYRNQKIRANGGQQQQPQQPRQPPAYQTQQQKDAEPISLTNNFRSRFNDSDSDSDMPLSAPVPQFANGNTLRKPQSSFTLRSASQQVSTPSPAKSGPADHRMTRYFSDSQVQVDSKTMKEVKEPKKRFGKLRRLFGSKSDK